MGSIIYINRHPDTWTVLFGDWRLKESFGGDKLIKVRYGTFDDDPSGAFDLEMFMRNSVYDKLLSGEYHVSPDSCFSKTLVIVDKTGKMIKPVKEDFCY